MLQAELSGQPYSKAEHNRGLQRRIGRNNGSIEFKHQNISAVLVNFRQPFIAGYLPRQNYQKLLEQAVLEWLSTEPRFFARLADGPGLMPRARPAIETSSPWSNSSVAPRLAMRQAGKARRPRIPGVFKGGATQPAGMQRQSNAAGVSPRAAMVRVTSLIEKPPDGAVDVDPGEAVERSARFYRTDFVRRDAENRQLGRLGEEWVVEFEQRRLRTTKSASRIWPCASSGSPIRAVTAPATTSRRS